MSDSVHSGIYMLLQLCYMETLLRRSRLATHAMCCPHGLANQALHLEDTTVLSAL